METLRYNYELRKAEAYFDSVDNSTEVDEDQLSLAEELINRKTSKFDPLKFKDLYQEGLKEIVEAKINKRAIKSDKGAPAPQKVVNIMEALRKSLDQTDDKKSSTPKEKSTPRKKSNTSKKTKTG